MTITGSSFAQKILTGGVGGGPMTPAQYEAALVAAIDAGGLAPFAFKYVPVTITQKLTDKKPHTLVIGVAPHKLAIGTADDWFLAPASPWTYQYVADKNAAILPSRKLTADIFRAALAMGVAIEPHPYPLKDPSTGKDDGGLYNESVPRFVESDRYIHDQLNKFTLPAGAASIVNVLTDGEKKDVVVAPNLDGSHVAIYGWYRLTDKQPWQNGYGPHEGTYKDYSHGGRMIARAAALDGKIVDLVDNVFLDPFYAPLVSDSGPFRPHFPNAGSMAAPAAFFPDGGGPTASSRVAEPVGGLPFELPTGKGGGASADLETTSGPGMGGLFAAAAVGFLVLRALRGPSPVR